MRCSQTVAYTTQKGAGPFPPGDRIMYVRLAFSRREGSCTYIYISYLYSYNAILIYIREQRAQQWDRRHSLFLTTRRRLLYYIGRAQFFSWFFSSSSTRAKTHPNHLNAPGEDDYEYDVYNIIYTLLKNAFLIPNRSLIYN